MPSVRRLWLPRHSPRPRAASRKESRNDTAANERTFCETQRRLSGRKARTVFRGKLGKYASPHGLDRQTAEIGIEILAERDEDAALDAEAAAAFGKTLFRIMACSIIIAETVKAAR